MVWAECLEVIGVTRRCGNGSPINDGFSFAKKCLEALLIQTLSPQGGAEDFPDGPD